jgi:YVTN family beta-propeller protein
MTLTAGARLGPYEILEVVGRGGMATVYKAHHPALKRDVAIKLLAANLAEDENFLERFRSEAVTVASLRHPNILQVFDFGEADGMSYLVTEFVNGTTLAREIHVETGPELVMDVLGPIAAALDYAHAQGILHRDVKPANVLISRDGTPVLADFGLARIVGSATGLTRTGTLIGTPEYMAPEQAAGGDAVAATDRYALAVIAYQMLCGRLPYQADTPLATLQAHLQRPLPLDGAAALPSTVRKVLMRGLAKRPPERYATAMEFVEALLRALTEPASSSAQAFPVTELVLEPTIRMLPATVVDAGARLWALIAAARERVAATIAARRPPHLVAFVVAGLLGMLIVTALSIPLAALRGALLSAEAVAATKLVQTLQIGGAPTALAVHPSNGDLYVADRDRATLLVVNPQTNEVKATVRVGKKPSAVALHRDGTRAYLTDEETNAMSIIDTARNAVVAITGTGRKPVAVTYEPLTNSVFVANRDSNTVSVFDADGRPGITIPVGRRPAAVAADRSSGRIYAANSEDASVSVIDARTGAVLSSVAVGRRPSAVAVDPAADRVYVANADADTLSLVSTRDGKLLGTIPVGRRPSAIAVSPTGAFVYVANADAGSISVADTVKATVVATLTVGKEPSGLAVGAGTRVYVANRGAGTIAFLD